MKNNQDFTEGSILSKMLRFMFPILGALVIQAMYSAVDLLVVGHFGTDAGISGVATGSNVIHMVTVTITALTTGVTVLIGRYLGEKNRERISPLIGGAVCFFGLLGIVISVILFVFARPLAILMQAPAEAVDLTADYIRICGGGFIFVAFYNFISAIFRGLGNSRLPLLFVGIACVVNVFGDLLFVAVLDMDVAGAAWATVLAQAVSVILSLLIIRKQDLPFKLSRADFRFGGEVSRFVKLGTPLALQDGLTNTTFLALAAFINNLGLSASSGYGIAQKIVAFVMLIPSAIMQSMSSFVSQNVGAGKEDRAKAAMRYGMLVGGAIGVLVALFSFFRGDLLALIFTSDPDYVKNAADYLRGFSVEAVITCVMFSYIGYFNGHGKALFVMIQGLCTSFLIRLPFAYFMSIRENASLTEIGLAAPVATVVGITVCTVYYLRMQKKMRAGLSVGFSE